MTANYYIIPGITTAPSSEKHSTLQKVEKAVCIYTGIDADVIYSPYRKREVVFARHLIMYFCRKKTNLTLNEIGMNFGYDHTTTLHGCRKIAGFLDIKDFVTCKAVEEIEMLIR
jgi:chromosomal replication initiator protein